MPNIKYTSEELVEAVQRLQSLTGVEKEVEASRKAGEILNNALDSFEKGLSEGLVQVVEEDRKVQESNGSSFDNSNISL